MVARPNGIPISGGYDLAAVVGEPVGVFQGERPSFDEVTVEGALGDR